MMDIVVTETLVIRGTEGLAPAMRAEAEARGLSERAFSEAAAGHPHLFDDLRIGVFPTHHVLVAISGFLGRPIKIRGLATSRHLDFRPEPSPARRPARAPARWFGCGWARDGQVQPWSPVGLVRSIILEQEASR